MIPAQLARTEEESRLKRIALIATARYWLHVGNKKQARINLSLARDERLSSRELLGEPPF